MGNWSNARLLVIGSRDEVVIFAKQARLRESGLFEDDMLYGEAHDLLAKRIRPGKNGLVEKRYLFQICNDDGRDHFLWVSERFPKLRFVLTYFHAADGSCGSSRLRAGRERHYEVPEALWNKLYVKHGHDPESEDSDDEAAYWSASWEAMDLAEAKALRR